LRPYGKRSTLSDWRILPQDIAFSWLLALRWGAVACQILLFAVVALIFNIGIPVWIVAAIIGFEAASNLFFSVLRRRRPVSDWLFALVMFLDIILFTSLLYHSGGVMNPFTFLYLVHIALGAILLRPRWSWALMFFTVLCYAGFFFPEGGVYAAMGSTMADLTGGWNGSAVLCHLPEAEPTAETHLALHLQGMLVAFAITAFFIVFFVSRIRQSLEEYQQIRVSLKEEKTRSERLASLATLAAGAAHEFSTPLSTIAVAAGEMLHYLKKHDSDQALIDDTVLIRAQVERCKEILYQMAADAGEHLGEAAKSFLVRDLVAEVLAVLGPSGAGRISFVNRVGALRIRMPYRTLKRALKGLVKNGRDASQEDGPIELVVREENGLLHFEVTDQGAGMDQATLDKAGEPFFTTKKPGKGLGLGLYLARTVAEQFGGYLRIDSAPGKGTRVDLVLTLAEITAS